MTSISDEDLGHITLHPLWDLGLYFYRLAANHILTHLPTYIRKYPKYVFNY